MNKRVTQIKPILLTFFLLISIGGYAQTHLLRINDQKFDLDEIKNITFSGNNLFVNTNGGDMFSASLTTLYFAKSETSIEDITEQKTTHKLYPNPVHDYLHIISEKPIGNVYIYDIHGKLVKYMETTENELSLDLSFLTSGLYLVKTTSQTTKIIKQ